MLKAHTRAKPTRLEMTKVTIDTNCIIDLEEERESACYIRALILMHGQGKIELSISAISGSERKPNGEYASSFHEFQQKINLVGLEGINILKPPGRYGVTFYDYCVDGDETIELEQKIHQVLFPSIRFKSSEEQNKKNWRNAKCDVLALCCHIKHGGDIFVTSDTNFHQQTKKPKLVCLGAGAIMYPKEAVEILTPKTTQTPSSYTQDKCL